MSRASGCTWIRVEKLNLIYFGHDRGYRMVNGRRLGFCKYIYIFILKLWNPLDALTTAHLAVIVSYVVDY